MRKMIIVAMAITVVMTMGIIMNADKIQEALQDYSRDYIYEESGINEHYNENLGKITLGLEINNLNDEEFEAFMERCLEIQQSFEDAGLDISDEMIQERIIELALDAQV